MTGWGEGVLARDSVLLQVTKDLPALRQPGHRGQHFPWSKFHIAEAVRDLGDPLLQLFPCAGATQRPQAGKEPTQSHQKFWTRNQYPF